ncbi:MAG: DUF1343 domain-containing protein [Deltaproteobacteria bacterium]|jgi:uncharacterized protein YbbC (DUF1343 family)|nr:DUF1343 domain-containing protein [Deltaproteobacteria bacterium]
MSKTKPGIEKLLETSPKWLGEKRIGLLINQASVDSHLRSTANLLVQLYPGNIKALFGPQHGIEGEKQDNMVESQDFTHPQFNIPVFSLYGATRIPTREMFEHIDILIIDLQDVGTRVYTFISTMAYCLEAAKQHGKKIVVLDRPNPIGGDKVEGNLLKYELRSFVGIYPIPMRHGLTIGELALLFNDHYQIGCELEVVTMEGWHRHMLFNETGLHWTLPSPNMPSPVTALVYPGQVILEGTNLSEGRGTTIPFQLCGAPFIDPYQLGRKVQQRKLPGILLREVFFQPTFNKWQNEVCGGLQIHLTDSKIFKPYVTTLAIVQDIISLYPGYFSWREPPYEYEREKMPVDLIIGDKNLREEIEQQKDINELENSWQKELEDFKELAKRYFLYD